MTNLSWGNKQKPFTFILNTPALLQFTVYGILVVPINFVWQRYIEARYPGFPRLAFARVRSKFGSLLRGIPILFNRDSTGNGTDLLDLSSIKDPSSSSSSSTAVPSPSSQSSSSSGLRNFIKKFLLDQTIGSVVNIVLFIVLINILKGVRVGSIPALVRDDFWPLMLARLAYRPVVSGLMYTVVPVDRRVVFGCACGVVWGVYLSLYASV